MTDSRFQLHDRIDSLTGELKAAEEQDRLNADDLAAKEHASSLARQAKEKSEANITRIKSKIREAGQAYSESVLALIGTEGAPLADEAAPAVEIEPMTPETVFVNGIGGNLVCTVCGGYDQHKPDCAAGHIGVPDAWVDSHGLAHRPEPFPNAIFNGIDRAFDEATQP